MATRDRILNILIKAVDQTKSAFSSAKNNASGFNSALGLVNNALGVFGLAIGAQQIFKFAQDTEAASRALNDARNALIATVGSAEAYEEVIRAVREETRGTVSKTEAAAGANVLLAQGLATNAREAAQLISAGNTLSSTFAAQGASMELFIRLLGSGSQVLLDNFNISRQQVAQRQKEIEALGVLSGEEARLQAIRDIAIQSSQKYSAAVSQETITAQRAKASYENMSAALGEVLTPAFNDGREGAVEFFDAISTSAEAFAAAREQALELAGAIRETTGIQIESNATWFDLAKNLNPVVGLLNNVAEAYRALAPEQAETPSDIEEIGAAAVQTGAQLEEYAAGLQSVIDKALSMSEASRAGVTASRDQGIAAQYAAETAEAAGARADIQARRNAANAQAIADQYAQQGEERKAADQAAAQAAEEAQRKVQQSLKTSESAATDFTSEIQNVINKLQGVTDAGEIPGLADMLGGTDQNPEDFAARLAAVARGGLAGLDSVWSESFKASLGTNPLFGPLAEAIAAGDSGGAQAVAQGLLQSNLPQVLAQGVIDGFRQQTQQQQLGAQINKIVTDAIGQQATTGQFSAAQVAAGDLTSAQADVQEGAAGVTEAVASMSDKIGEAANAAIGPLQNWYEILAMIAGVLVQIGANAQNASNQVAGAGLPSGASVNQNTAIGPSPGL